MSETVGKCAICNESSSNLYTLGCCVHQYHKTCIAQILLNEEEGLCPQCQHKIDKANIKPIGNAEPPQAFTLRSSGQMARSAAMSENESKK